MHILVSHYFKAHWSASVFNVCLIFLTNMYVRMKTYFQHWQNKSSTAEKTLQQLLMKFSYLMACNGPMFHEYIMPELRKCLPKIILSVEEKTFLHILNEYRLVRDCLHFLQLRWARKMLESSMLRYGKHESRLSSSGVSTHCDKFGFSNIQQKEPNRKADL